eukprot:CAMPEP_0197321762 /NCGR_PEP_ID=MMETSP0891-20130614/66260_1 /TAXON_ID=44058 ORGANISM="Aureoumbra lagunensis, Strain CCMP1510" /NCGR_SAMPLE_ID=MMETSP0891 /ASSEMBLY_ACC=CAM_ASM_000534 /LENGTH=606 /DNA_ID=CAMNT_0042813807 /DNA_START=348 /DNA_END=2168 /DNA_ORIENTATION=-
MAAHEMRQLEKENIRKRRIYEHMLVEWYDQRRQQLLQATLYDDFTNAQKAKIVSRRRAEETEKRKRKKEREQHLKEILEQRRIEEWITEWEQFKKDRIAALEQKLRHCYDKPEIPEEEAIQRKLIADTKKRMKIILQRDTNLELGDARKLALEEVMEQRLKDEERRVEEDQRDAADAYYAAQAAKTDAARIKTEREADRTRHLMASRIQKQFSFFKARKRLRALCIQRFSKEYDAQSQTYYYRDSRTGTAQWRKPFALGIEYDIRVKHRWLVFKDETNVPYFYNPATLEMQWKVPQGTKICQRCQAAFAERFCNEMENFVCVTCYDVQHAHLTQEERNIMSWKVIDGSTPDADTIDLNNLQNFNPLGRHLLKHDEEKKSRRELTISFVPEDVASETDQPVIIPALDDGEDILSNSSSRKDTNALSDVPTLASPLSAMNTRRTKSVSEVPTLNSPTTCLESPESPQSVYGNFSRTSSETSLTSTLTNMKQRHSKRRRRSRNESLLTTAQKAATDYLNEINKRFDDLQKKHAHEIYVAADEPNVSEELFPNCRNGYAKNLAYADENSSLNTNSQSQSKSQQHEIEDSSISTSILDHLLESAALVPPRK